MPTRAFRVVALVATYNEEDIIGDVLTHLIDHGLDVYVIDNRSTDATAQIASRFLGRGVIGIEHFVAPGIDQDDRHFYWEAILARKEHLAQHLDADWFIHHDADEIRESPWANLRLREAIQLVDRLGYNAIDWDVLNFWPTTNQDDANAVRDFEFFERARAYDRLQVKCWKKTSTPIEMTTTGGHDVVFDGRRVFPLRFIVRHYPIRSQAHGERKVFAERLDRFAPSERERGWHVQYDEFAPGASFVRDAATLTRYEPDVVRAELALRHRGVEVLERQGDSLRNDAEQARQLVQHVQHEIAASRADAESARADAQSARTDAQSARADAQSARVDAQSARAEALRLRTEVDSANADLQTARADLERARAEAHTARLESESVTVLVESARADAQLARDEAEFAREELQAARLALESERDAVRADAETLARSLAAVRADHDRVECELRTAEMQRAVRDRELAEARDELRQAHADIERTAAALDGLRRDHDTVYAALTRAESALHAAWHSWSWRVTAPLRMIAAPVVAVRAALAGRRSVGFESRFLAGAAHKGWVAFREGRFEFSPTMWRIHLRNYRREITPAARPPDVSLGPGPTPSVVHGVPDAVRVARAGARATDGPRFLVITDAVPTPNLDSGSVRLFHILKLLVEIGYVVTFASHSDELREKHANDVRDLGIDILYGPEAVSAHLVEHGSSYRFVLLSRPEIAFRYLFPVRAAAIDATIVYDTVDLHWLRLTRAAELTGDESILGQATYYRRVERFNATASDLVLTVTALEQEQILADDPACRVDVLPNIHPIEASEKRWSDRHGLMFIGGFWHQPNEDAVHFFIDQVLPLIVKVIPDIVFTIIGSHMPESVRALASANVRPLGYVHDPLPIFAESRVFVSPLRYGAGMKGKIGQSMSCGLPVVTTSIGAEGMLLVDGETALVADTPQAFADAVVRLYRDQELWQRVSARSVAHIIEHFSDDAVRRRLRRLFPLPVPGSLPHDVAEMSVS